MASHAMNVRRTVALARKRLLAVLPLTLGVLLCPAAGAAGEPALSWWQAETALNDQGELVLAAKPWWAKAKALAVGEHFAVRSELPGGGAMRVRRERLDLRGGKSVEAVVWVIDDDGDMRPDDPDGDTDSDCYVVDYDGDGRVDRLVDYLDNDGDGKPDEMDIRYFWAGQLRIAWFGVDLDKKGRTWSMRNYDYYQGPGFFACGYAYGNNMIYANKYDPQQKRWWPISECPFAFYDTNGDGWSDAVVRVSAAPLDFDPVKEVDFGNSGWSYREPFTERLRRMGAVNVRYSVDLDGLASTERPLHYDMGFNLIGRLPYQFPGMARENPLRRPPKTTICTPHRDLRRVAETYPAEQTGLSFREYGDEQSPIGDRLRAGECRRWEGVFWTWNRRIMHNTGGPTQEWNTRREFRGTPSDKRELYYCRADRRVHLKGAGEGWIRVGHLGNAAPWGEIRYFDTDGDGAFDRWETWLAGASRPARVSTVIDAGLRPLPADWDELRWVYTKELLPESLRANEKLMAAMQKVEPFQAPEHLAKALAAATCDSERRYVQDILRETQFLALRDRLFQVAQQRLEAVSEKAPRGAADRMAASAQAWRLVRLASGLDAAYGDGRYDDAVQLLDECRRSGALP